VLTRARVLAVAALLSGVVGSYVWLNTGNGHHAARHAHKVVAALPDTALDRALRYIPSNSRFIVVAQTSQRLAAMQSLLVLANRLPGAACFSAGRGPVAEAHRARCVDRPPVAARQPDRCCRGPQGRHDIVVGCLDAGRAAEHDRRDRLHSAGTYRSTQL